MEEFLKKRAISRSSGNMKNLLLIFVPSFILLSAKAQDLQLTQLFAAPMFVNPAFTGANVCSRVILTSRNQWPGISKPYSTSVASFDHNLYRHHSGIGL